MEVIRHDEGNRRTPGHFECTFESSSGGRCDWVRRGVSSAAAISHVETKHGRACFFVGPDKQPLRDNRGAKISKGKVRKM